MSTSSTVLVSPGSNLTAVPAAMFCIIKNNRKSTSSQMQVDFLMHLNVNWQLGLVTSIHRWI